MDTGVALQVRRAVDDACDVGPNSGSDGLTIDYERLSTEVRTAFDDGGIPDFWREWWLTQARQIQRLPGAALLVVEPGILGRRRVEPLQIDGLVGVIGSTPWSIPGGVILGWGLSENKRGTFWARRIKCSGALASVVDGCGAVLVSHQDTVRNWTWYI